MNRNDFAGKDFAPERGEVYGLRAWRIAPTGRLRPLHIGAGDDWTVGENVAKCHANYYNPLSRVVDPDGLNRTAMFARSYERQVTTSYQVKADWSWATYSNPTTWPSIELGYKTVVMYEIMWNTGETSLIEDKDLKFRVPELDHSAPVDGCSCGFYAYLSERHGTFNGPGLVPHVLGIIKGYGKTLIGEKGFRCEKAEIVAVQDPRTAAWAGLSDGWQLRADSALHALLTHYPSVPVLPSRRKLLEFAPLGQITEEKTA